VVVCVDASSPSGTYKFRNSGWNNHTALVNGFWSGSPFFAGGDDPGDGGDALAPNNGSTVWTPAKGDNSEYIVTPGDAGCVTVLDRTAPSAHYSGEDPVYHFGPDHQDDWQAINVTASTFPSTAQYDHTDCLMDDGVVDPQPTPCGNTNNPTRAFANYDHGTKITFVFTQAPVLTECTLGYPDSSHLPQSNAAFNESEVLTGFGLSGSGGSRILHAWYTDEHALTLGVDSVFVNNKNPTPDQGYHYTFDNMAGNMTSTLTAGITGSPVNVGRTSTASAPIGLANPMDGAGRLLAPGLYLTDLNTNPNPRGGDWQQGGTPIFPSAVYGTWKGAIITIDNTKNPPATSLTPRADPSKNHKVVGGAGINPPSTAWDGGYSSDIQWSLSSLGLTSGHAYRAQIIVHDGDQNKTGGDVGQACINIQN
jgi:hypothetical protein